ncbi:MAG: DivIVA domain-containing protein [Burkholderiaceae bacterium]|nr:DivIVA domain-containing protein [Microbacteriaceae bacterium]
MALTPEDVVNKRFQPTKFREGYDQDEVDDFLDEVVVELRRLNQENEEFRQRLNGSESQRAVSPVAETPEAVAAEPVVAEPVVADPIVDAPVVAAPDATEEENEVTSTNNLLQLARRLHEEHVKEGVDKRDALISEGHATAARLVSEAEAKQRIQLAKLDQDRSVLEGRIDELRTFEREYRQKLKGYIEGQLRDLAASDSPSDTEAFAQGTA